VARFDEATQKKIVAYKLTVLPQNIDMMNISRFPRRPQAGYCIVSAFVVALVVVTGVSSPGGSDGTVSAQALGPCALLTTSEIQPLAVNASVADGVWSSVQAFGSVTCRYTWGVGTDRFKLTVIVNEAAGMFPSMSPDQIKQRLLESVKAGTTDAIIPDLGDVAVFKSDSPFYARATAFLKNRLLEVHLDGFVARERKDQAIELLKSAASRL
jgi:hypothetical protein